MKEGFVKDNMASIAELIDFTSREFTDTYVLERIVNFLVSIIREEKKRINRELHYLRQKNIDSTLLFGKIFTISSRYLIIFVLKLLYNNKVIDKKKGYCVSP